MVRSFTRQEDRIGGVGGTIADADDVNLLQIAIEEMSPMTSVGDTIVGGTAGIEERVAIGTEGQIYTVTDIGAGVKKPRWGAAPTVATFGVLNLPRWVTGRYYDVTSSVAASFSTGTYATGTLIAVLLYVPNTNTADRIAIGISTAATAGRKARLGIYAMGSDGNPGALVLDAGEVATDSTGTVAATISQSLTGGTWYWLAVTFSNTTGTVYRTVPAGGPVGYANIDSNSNDSFSVDKVFAYGVLPDPFGTPAIRLGHVPRIGVRAG